MVPRELLRGEGRPVRLELEGLQGALKETFGLERASPSCGRWAAGEMVPSSPTGARARYEEKERLIGPERVLFHQRMIMLQIVDTQWKDHLYSLDHLKEGIGLRGYGQRDPLVEYKKESFQMFQALMDRIDEEILRWIFLYQPVAPPETAGARRPRRRAGARGPARGPAPAGGPEPELALAGRQDGAAEPQLQRPRGHPVGLRPRRPAAGGRGRDGRGPDGAPRGAEGRAQRPLPLRERQEVQEVPRELNPVPRRDRSVRLLEQDMLMIEDR